MTSLQIQMESQCRSDSEHDLNEALHYETRGRLDLAEMFLDFALKMEQHANNWKSLALRS